MTRLPTAGDLLATLHPDDLPGTGIHLITFTHSPGNCIDTELTLLAQQPQESAALPAMLRRFATGFTAYTGLGLYSDVLGYGITVAGAVYTADRYGYTAALLAPDAGMPCPAMTRILFALQAMVASGPGLHQPTAPATAPPMPSPVASFLLPPTVRKPMTKPDATGPNGPAYPHVSVQLSGRDGNILSIIGRVSTALRHQIGAEAANAYVAAAMTCSSYDEALQLTMRTVDIS